MLSVHACQVGRLRVKLNDERRCGLRHVNVHEIGHVKPLEEHEQRVAIVGIRDAVEREIEDRADTVVSAPRRDAHKLRIGRRDDRQLLHNDAKSHAHVTQRLERSGRVADVG